MGIITLIPNGPGYSTGIDIAVPNVTHYLNIDDPSGTPDDDSTRLEELANGIGVDYYTLPSGNSIPVGNDIKKVTVFFRFRKYDDYVSSCTPGLRLNSIDNFGSQQLNYDTTYTTYNQVISRPNGGQWTEDDINNLQVIIRINNYFVGMSVTYVTQVYVEVEYDLIIIIIPSENLAYLCSGNYPGGGYVGGGTFSIIDINDPLNLQLDGHVLLATSPDFSDDYTELAIKDNYAYMVSPGWNFLTIVDISDKTNPFIATKFSLGTPGQYYPLSISIKDNVAFIASAYSDDELISVNISDPINPSSIQSVQMHQDSSGAFQDGFSIAIKDDYAFVGGNNTIQVFDISDPSNMTWISQYEDLDVFDEFEDILIEGDTAYCSMNGWNDAFYILNISNVNNLTLISKTMTSDGITNIAKQGNTLFLCCWGDDSFQSWNISNLATPTLIQSVAVWLDFYPPSFGRPTQVQLDDNYAFISVAGNGGINSTTGMIVINISNPANMTLIDYISDSDFPETPILAYGLSISTRRFIPKIQII